MPQILVNVIFEISPTYIFIETKLKRGRYMTNHSIYKDIEARTGGDIYIGIVGPVRTGKSTFIKRFMDTLVLPRIKEDFVRERATDELPQSSSGRTIMTTEPKFIPENAVSISIDEAADMKVRLIDCVGYIVPSSLGYIENDNPRMVDTPWFDEPVPFNMAAEIGTKKVITEHSTIGLVVTTDGSISEIPREEYKEAEMRVIEELRAINKPFVVLLNSTEPESERVRKMAAELTAEYGVSVIPINCLELTEEDINRILANILYEFPVCKIKIDLPLWLGALESGHPINQEITDTVRARMGEIKKISDIKLLCDALKERECVMSAETVSVDLGRGEATLSLGLCRELFYKTLSENTKLPIKNDRELMDFIAEMKTVKTRYEKIKNALDEVEATGYGIVMPDIEELSLEEPEIMKQQGRYGVRLRASAPSIHMMKANITTEVSPIVGTEKQSEDLIMYLLSEFDDDPVKIWESNIFGKSLHELVNEGLHTKLSRMPADARMRIQETIERVINEGCNGLVCIII